MSTTLTPRCIVIEQLKTGIHNLPEFGTVEYVFDNNRRRASIYDPKNLEYQIRQELQDLQYNPAVDYIVVAGGMILVAQLIHCVTATYPLLPINVLFYDARDSVYHANTLGA
jgi:hypothetical protein